MLPPFFIREFSPDHFYIRTMQQAGISNSGFLMFFENENAALLEQVVKDESKNCLKCDLPFEFLLLICCFSQNGSFVLRRRHVSDHLYSANWNIIILQLYEIE